MRRFGVWVISRKALREAWEKHPDWEKPLKSWFTVAEHAQWENLFDVRKTYPHADSVGRCTVFNIGGNKCRLVAWINFRYHRVFIRHVLTHEEYDKGGWKNDCDRD